MDNVSKKFIEEFDKEAEELKNKEGALMYAKLTESGALATGSQGNGIYLIGAITGWLEEFSKRTQMSFDSVVGQVMMAHKVGLELYCNGNIAEENQ